MMRSGWGDINRIQVSGDGGDRLIRRVCLLSIYLWIGWQALLVVGAVGGRKGR